MGFAGDKPLLCLLSYSSFLGRCGCRPLFCNYFVLSWESSYVGGGAELLPSSLQVRLIVPRPPASLLVHLSTSIGSVIDSNDL